MSTTPTTPTAATTAKFKPGDKVHYTPAPVDPPPVTPLPLADPPYPWKCQVEGVKTDADGKPTGVCSVVTDDSKHAFDAKEAELTAIVPKVPKVKATETHAATHSPTLTPPK